ncbi:MAG: hypothetical protein QXL96_11025 [Ignisphaera sp.]
MYCGNTEGLAQHLCSTIKIADPSTSIIYFDAEYSYNIVLPYLTEMLSTTILLSSATDISCAFKVLQALSLLGVETMALLPAVTATTFKDYTEEWSQNIYLLELDNSIYRLSILQTSLRLALTLAENNVARIKRIERELNMSSIVKELIDKYTSTITSAKSLVKPNIAVTKALIPAAEELMDRGIATSVIGRYSPEEKNPNLLMYTSVEEQTVNEYLLKLARKGIKRSEILTIRLNTDPLTAPIYALIIFYAMIL